MFVQEDNISHLYGPTGTVKLSLRFTLVDLEAPVAVLSPKDKSTTHPRVTGPLPYIGGKNRIANQIIEIFPDHTAYVEPFSGGAQVFFHKEPSRVEVLNDLNGDIVNFFRICQSHHEELLRCLRFVVVSRKWHELFKKQNADTLTDIQRAARFLYLQKTSYAGLVRDQNYNFSVVNGPRFNPESLPELIEQTYKRLHRVQIECLPYERVLDRFDRPSTLFYLDPPYFGLKLYTFNFEQADFVTLEARLRAIQGKFVLSLNDVPEVRRIFHRFHFQEIEIAYTAQRTAGKRYHELLITNYVPKKNGSSRPS